MARKNKSNPYYKYVPVISARRIIHHVMSFGLTILIFLMAASISTVTGYLNDNSVKKAVQSDEFYTGVRENIIKECQAIAIPSMIDEDIFYTIFSKKQITEDVKDYMVVGVKGFEYDFQLDDLKQNLINEIIANLKENNIQVTATTKKDINTFAEQVLDVYSSNITISYFESYAQIKGTAKPIAIVVFIASIILSLAMLFIMVAMYRFKVVHKTIRMFAYALGGAGTLLIGLFGYCKARQIGSGLQLRPQYIYDAMQRYIQNGLNTYIFFGVVLIILALALAFVSESLRSRVKKNYFERLEVNFRESLNEELENKNFTPDLDMTNREEKAKKAAHDEFNRYAMDKLDAVTLNEERERTESTKGFELPIINPAQHDDFTEVNVQDEDEQ